MNKAIITLIFSLCACFSITGQTSVGQLVQASYQKINVGKANEAIADLEKLVLENPEHPALLTALGYAYRITKEYPESVKWYKQAQKANPKNGVGLFNLGVAYALANQIDLAFERLTEAKESNSFNITNIGLSPAASILQTDARYRSLFPTGIEYADPFVEEGVTILQDWKGEHASDQFGWIGRNIGDVDNDGVMDVVSSAPTNSEGGNQAGKIYVYSGKTGRLIWSYVSNEASGQLGMSVETAGDVNGDGVGDVIAGAPYVNTVVVLSGSNGNILYKWKGDKVTSAFGRGVKGVGDVNNDGHSDLLIGAPYQIWGAPLNNSKIDSPGKAYLYSGKDGAILQTWIGGRIGDGFGTALAGKTTNGSTLLMIGAPLSGATKKGQVYVFKGMDKDPFFMMNADKTGNSLGAMFMSVVGDINGDEIQDVYASDFSNSALGASTGRAYIHSGATGEQLLVLTGEKSGDGFGIGVADAGDANQDGCDDLIIGAWQHASAAPSGGKVYLYSGKDGSLIRTITGKVIGETLGFDTTNIGDVNGDGAIDFLLTSAWSAINGSQSGRMLIISGK